MNRQQQQGALAQHLVIGAIGGTPPPGREEDSALSPARLRCEQQSAYFNDVHLLDPLPYLLVGLDTRILQINVAGAELLGVAREQPGALLLRDFVHPAFLPDFERCLRHALNGHAQQLQLQMLPLPMQGGHALALTLRASADGGGQALRIALEPAEGRLAALERSEQRLRRIVHSSAEGVWEIDAGARTSFINPKMASMLGYRIEQMLGRPLLEFMDEEGRAIVEANIARSRQGLTQRHEFKFLRADGGALWATLASYPLVDDGGAFLGALALVSDLGEPRAFTERSWRQASFDQLTMLPNRHMLADRLHNALKKAQREGAVPVLLLIGLGPDLDAARAGAGFDTERAEFLLAQAARRIAACARASDTVASLGGGEFGILLDSAERSAGAQAAAASRVAQDILDGLAPPFTRDGGDVVLSAAIGIALYPVDGGSIGQLLERAGAAMAAAAQAGPNRCHFHNPALQAQVELRSRTAQELRRALAAGQFELHYQAIVELDGGAVRRAEALLRWRHPQRGLLAAADFIDGAEQAGLMDSIGDWVFHHGAQQLAIWQHELDPAFQLSINNSAAQLRGGDSLDAGWLDCMAQRALAPGSIVIDVSASALRGAVSRGDGLAGRLRQLRAMGLSMALDDFGGAECSLACLGDYELDFLKLAPQLLPDAAGGPAGAALCEAVIAMAHKLGLKVVAEGVETVAQWATLERAGCDYAQGHVFAAALPAAQFGALARAANHV